MPPPFLIAFFHPPYCTPGRKLQGKISEYFHILSSNPNVVLLYTVLTFVVFSHLGNFFTLSVV